MLIVIKLFNGQNIVCKYTRAMKNENLSGQQYIFSSEQNKLDKMKNKTITTTKATKRTIKRNSDNITINLFSNTA